MERSPKDIPSVHLVSNNKRRRIDPDDKKNNKITHICRDTAELICSWLDCAELLSLNLCCKEFHWISSHSLLSIAAFRELNEKKLFRKRHNLYSPKTFNTLRMFNHTKIFKAYSRTMSYDYWNSYSLINPHCNKEFMNSIKATKLNLYEKELFHVYKFPFLSSNNSNEDNNNCLINDRDEFINQLNKRFAFNQWKDLINWNQFFLAGGAALNCLLKQPFESDDNIHDIDLFAINMMHYEFELICTRFAQQNNKLIANATTNSSRSVFTLKLRVRDDKIVKIQFILNDLIECGHTKEGILNEFDLDCCQVGFDGKTETVLCSYAFLQSLTTKTMICYRLRDDIKDMIFTFYRIYKYSKRGFNRLLIPKQFEKYMKIFGLKEFCDENAIKKFIVKKKKDFKELSDDEYFDPFKNADPFNVERHFTKIVVDGLKKHS